MVVKNRFYGEYCYVSHSNLGIASTNDDDDHDDDDDDDCVKWVCARQLDVQVQLFTCSTAKT